MTRAKKPRPKKKTKIWTTPTVLGLIVGGLGLLGLFGLFELRPQLTATSKEFLEPNQPFTAPFEITNIGYLAVHIEDVTVIEHKVELPNKWSITDAFIHQKGWESFDLERAGGSKTILPNLANVMPIKADIVISVDYVFLWHTWRKYFRFEGLHMSNWQWSKQPIGDLEPDMDKVLADALERRKNSPLFRP